MKKYPFYPVLFSLLIGLSCMQCTLDEGNPGSSNPALTLSIQPELSILHLNWQPVRTTGFKEYILLQSAGDIPNSPTPIINQDVTVLTRINEINTTTFSTTNILFASHSCYKLYCSIDDRFIYSGTVCADQPTTIIPGFFDRVGHDVNLPQIAMFDRVNIRLVAFDDSNDIITNSIPENNLSFPQLDLSVYEGTNRLFSYDLSSPQIRKYSFPELLLQNQRFLGETVFGGLAWKNFVFMAFQNSSNGFQILNASTFATIDTKQGLTSNRNIAVFEGDPLIVLEIADAAIIRYQVNAQGKVIQADQFSTGAPQPGTQNTCDFNTDYYIGGRLGSIINREAEVVTSLQNGVNAFTQFCRFTPDGTEAITIASNNVSTNLEIYDITNVLTPVKIKSYTLPNATFSDLYIRNGVLNLIGVNFNSSSPQTFFLQFPL